MLDYQTKGYTKYGADMGRRSDLAEDTTATLTLRHVPITDGYDPGGAYWGSPDNLYCVSDEDGNVAYLRASGADAARAKFPRATFAPVTEGPTEGDLAEMLDGYIECALWSTNDESTEDGGEPFDANYSADDLAPEAREAMRTDVEAFAKANAATILAALGHGRCDWSRAGHDFWLTRCGHGINFSDNWPEAQAELLNASARKMGEVYLYLGDDGRIYA